MVLGVDPTEGSVVAILRRPSGLAGVAFAIALTSCSSSPPPRDEVPPGSGMSSAQATESGEALSVEATSSTPEEAGRDGPLLVTEPELISRQPKAFGAYFVPEPSRVGVGWGGRVTVIWYHSNKHGIVAARRRIHGGWSRPELIARTHELDFDLAAGRGSRVSVAWTAWRDGLRVVRETHWARTGWSPPVTLGRGFTPEVAVDGAGQTTVMWTTREGVARATRGARGRWRGEQIRGEYWTPEIAADKAGNEAAIWGAPDGLAWAFRPATSSEFTEPRVMPTGSSLDFRATRGYRLALTQGRALAAWSRGDDDERGGDIYASYGDIDTGTWSAIQRVPGEVGFFGEYGAVTLSSLADRGHGVVVVHGRGLLSESVDLVARVRSRRAC